VIGLELWNAKSSLQEATEGGLGRLLNFAPYGSTTVSLGRHDAARDADWQRSSAILWVRSPCRARTCRVTSRTGDVALLDATLEWMSERTRATPTDWALGIEARIRALVSDVDAARALTGRIRTVDVSSRSNECGQRSRRADHQHEPADAVGGRHLTMPQLSPHVGRRRRSRRELQQAP
jgi:hypothetical protein